MRKINNIIEILRKIYQLIRDSQLSFNLPVMLEEKPMTRQQVKEYLGISESTYKRKVKDGTLKPLKMPGGDRYYKKQLINEFQESKRRGRT